METAVQSDAFRLSRAREAAAVRTNVRFRTVMLMSCAIVTFAFPARAQEVDVSRLEQAATTGAAVSVIVEGESTPIRGHLRTVTQSTIVLDVEGKPANITLDRVSRIDRDGDSLTNGILIGASILGGWCALVCGQGSGDPFSYGAIVAGNAAIGGLIGAWADATRNGTTTVYRRASKAGVRLAFSGRGVALAVGF